MAPRKSGTAMAGVTKTSSMPMGVWGILREAIKIPMGVWGILREAIKIPLRNGMLMLSTALLLLISLSLIFLGNYFALVPVTMDLVDLVLKNYFLGVKDLTSSEYAKLLAGIQEDIQILMGEETIITLAAYVSTVLLTLAIIYVSAASYSGKHLNHRQLVSIVRRTWKGPVITSLHVTIFNLGFIALFIPLGVALVVTVKGSIIFIAAGVLMGLLLILWLFLAVIWKLALLVSAVEEGYSGLRALGRAEELFRGRKLQGFVLSLLLYLVYLVIAGVFTFKFVDIKLAEVARLAIGLASICVGCIVQLFNWMVFTVFYFECKKSHGQEVEIQVESGYELVSTTTNLDASLP